MITEKEISRCWPCGRVFNFMCSASVAWGLRVQILGTDICTTDQAMLWLHLTQENQNDLQLGYTTMCWGFGVKKKMEDWQQMLAQGQSSSSKSKEKEKTFCFFLSSLYAFWYFLTCIALAQTSSTMLNRHVSLDTLTLT